MAVKIFEGREQKITAGIGVEAFPAVKANLGTYPNKPPYRRVVTIDKTQFFEDVIWKWK